MTHARPMFPPRADRAARSEKEGAAKTCQIRRQVSTCSRPAQVELEKNCDSTAQYSLLNWVNSQVEPSHGADAAPRDSLDLGGARREQPNNAVPIANSISGRSETAPPEGPYVRTDISPEDLLKALGRLRREAEAEIERLIDLLDDIGPDPDLEPVGDELESALGALENHPETPVPSFYRTRALRHSDRSGDQTRWGDQGNLDDREGDAGHDDREGDELEHGGCGERDDDELSGDENEPSLGSFDRLTNQDHGWRQTGGNSRNWILRHNSDAEVEHDGREPDDRARRTGRAR